MQEVGGVLKGQYDYAHLRGDTGPLVYVAAAVGACAVLAMRTGSRGPPARPASRRPVLRYPAGFVYVYSWLYWLTDHGANIRRAQWIFVGLYLATTAVVLAIYRRTRVVRRWSSCSTNAERHGPGADARTGDLPLRAVGPARPQVPPWVMGLLALSKRVHSIFALRLFNDPVAMLLLYCAVLLAMRNRWTVASLALTYAARHATPCPPAGRALMRSLAGDRCGRTPTAGWRSRSR